MSFILKNIRINRAPGFPNGFKHLLEFKPGFNLVFGRNATGKTVLSQTIQKLIWRRQIDRHDATGEIALDGQTGSLAISYEKQIEQWAPGPIKSLQIDKHQDKLYLLSHEQILRDTDKGGDIAAAILKEYSGGYNIDVAKRSAGGDRPVPRRVNPEFVTLTNAETGLNDTRAAQENLSERQKLLSELKKRRLAADKAAARQKWLEDVLRFLREKERTEYLKAEVDGYPAKIDRISSHVCQALETSKKEMQDLTDRGNIAQRALEETVSRLESLHPATQNTSKEQVQTLQRKIEAYKKAVEEQSDLEADLEGLKAEEQAHLSRFGIDAENPYSITSPELGLAEVKNLIRSYQLWDARQAALQARQAVNQEQIGKIREDIPAAENLVRAEDALKQWLQTSRRAGMPRLVPYIIIALGFLFSYFLIINTGKRYLLTIEVLASIATLMFYAMLNAYYGRQQKERPDIDTDHFRKWGIAPPAEQTVSTMTDILHWIIGLREDIHTRERLTNSKRDVEQELQIVSEQKERIVADLQETRSRLINLPDTTPEQDPEIILNYLSNWDKWHDLQARKEHAEGLVKNQRQIVQNLAEEWTALAAIIPITDSKDADRWLIELQGFINQLEKRREWSADLKKSEKDLNQNVIDKSAKQKAIDELLMPFLPEYETLEKLRELNLRKGEYQNKVDEYNAALRNAGQLEKSLRKQVDDATVLEIDLSKGMHGLEEEIHACSVLVDEKDDITRQISEIEHEVKQVQDKFPLETAIKAKDEALEKLDELMVSYLKSKTIVAIADLLKETVEMNNRPKVLQIASNLFNDFTNNRYTLNVDHDANGRFIAHDREKGMHQDVSELSTATKIQLILAVRLAYIENVEDGTYCLPILADELLAGSDDERSKAIMEALIKVARNGRQVFYFTAEGDELGRWEQMLKEDGIEYGVVPLGDSPMPLVIPPKNVINPLASISLPPDPQGKNHAEYGKELALGAFDLLQAEIGRLHPWYIFEEVDLIHELLRWNQKNWAMMRTAFERSGVNGPLAEDDYRRAEQVMEVLKVYQSAYKKGKPLPVGFDVIIDSGCIGNAFIEKVEGLLNKVKNDPEKLLQGLMVLPHFQKKKVSELKDYLIKEGCISEEDKMSEEEIADMLLEHINKKSLDNKYVERCIDRILKGPL